jgi:methylamine dehydrogenase accessory protein MauD
VVLCLRRRAARALAFYEKADLKDFPYVLSSRPGMAYRVAKLPYAVLIERARPHRAKGLVNSREQLESLFTAKELGVASVQDFIDHQHA